MAQFGRALGSGPRGRQFKSVRPDLIYEKTGACILYRQGAGSGVSLYYARLSQRPECLRLGKEFRRWQGEGSCRGRGRGFKRFTESSIERVKSLSNILVNTKISNFDYEEVISTDGEDVFLFLDPPYYSATKSALYGKNGTLHKIFDHERFANVMKRTNHKWLITYDDSEYIRNLFSFANPKFPALLSLSRQS